MKRVATVLVCLATLNFTSPLLASIQYDFVSGGTIYATMTLDDSPFPITYADVQIDLVDGVGEGTLLRLRGDELTFTSGSGDIDDDGNMGLMGTGYDDSVWMLDSVGVAIGERNGLHIVKAYFVQVPGGDYLRATFKENIYPKGDEPSGPSPEGFFQSGDWVVHAETVPEPSSLLVWGVLGALCLAGRRYRSKRKRPFPNWGFLAVRGGVYVYA